MYHLTIEQRKKIERAKKLCESVLKESGTQYSGEINEPFLAAMNFWASIGLEEREVFSVLFLDNQNRLLKSDNLFYGTVNQTNIYIREIIKAALLCNAAAIIIGHNHPSGNVEPSDADSAMTNRVRQACELMDIRFLDHIIVGHKAYYSFESNSSEQF